MTKAFALLAATVALAGCASGSAEQSAPPSEPDENRGFENRAAAERFLADALAQQRPAASANVPEGFRLRSISEAGIALALPARRAALRARDARQPGILRLVGGVATVQYVVVSDGQETIVTLTTLPALKQRYERLFEASLRTLRPTG